MIRSPASLACLLAAALLGGCYTLRAEVPGTVRGDVRDAVVVGTFDREISHTYLLNGLVNPPPDDIFAAEMIAAVREKGGDGMANLVFETRFSPVDYGIALGSCGIIAPRTYRLRGDIVRLSAPPVPGKPLLVDDPQSRAYEKGGAP